jgi:nucleotide-binding universal stress UspA family protein
MFKKILVPTDGSALAKSAGSTAAELAHNQGADIVAVYVIDPFPYIGIGDASAVGLQAYLAESQQAASQALDAIGTVCASHGVPFSGTTIERGAVYEGILDTAQSEGCDLIIMASHGRLGVKALILGSVTQKVLTHSTVPVLVVKG